MPYFILEEEYKRGILLMNQSVSGREAGLENIVFYETPAYGYVNPTLPVISELVKRGYHVQSGKGVWKYDFSLYNICFVQCNT